MSGGTLMLNIDRYFSPRFRPFGNLSKIVKVKNKKHRDYIKQLPCKVTGTEVISDCHHVRRKSQIQNDYLTIPLCSTIHNELHLLGIETFQNKHGIDLKDCLIATLVEKIMVLEGVEA